MMMRERERTHRATRKKIKQIKSVLCKWCTLSFRLYVKSQLLVLFVCTIFSLHNRVYLEFARCIGSKHGLPTFLALLSSFSPCLSQPSLTTHKRTNSPHKHDYIVVGHYKVHNTLQPKALAFILHYSIERLSAWIKRLYGKIKQSQSHPYTNQNVQMNIQ